MNWYGILQTTVCEEEGEDEWEIYSSFWPRANVPLGTLWTHPLTHDVYIWNGVSYVFVRRDEVEKKPPPKPSFCEQVRRLLESLF